MKALLVIAILLLPYTSFACPPLNQHPDAVAERERRYRQVLLDAAGIAYGVVERDISSDDRKRPGIFRVVHIYRGTFVAGEKIKLRHDEYPNPCNSDGIHAIEEKRGKYGVALIKKARSGEIAFRFVRFMSEQEFSMLVQEGFIRSAQPIGVEP